MLAPVNGISSWMETAAVPIAMIASTMSPSCSAEILGEYFVRKPIAMIATSAIRQTIILSALLGQFLHK